MLGIVVVYFRPRLPRLKTPIFVPLTTKERSDFRPTVNIEFFDSSSPKSGSS